MVCFYHIDKKKKIYHRCSICPYTVIFFSFWQFSWSSLFVAVVVLVFVTVIVIVTIARVNDFHDVILNVLGVYFVELN